MDVIDKALSQMAKQGIAKKEAKKGLVILLATFLLIPILPVLFIWAVNTLFGLGIELTYRTWLAALVIIVLVSWGGR